MDYNNDEMGGGPAPPMEEGHDESMHEGQMGSLYLTPDMLPSGMKLNPGDIVEFKVVGQDKDGDWEVTYNTGDKGEDMSWENDLKKEMSPRTMEES